MLAITTDPDILDSDGSPLHVVTMRAFIRPAWATYKALASWELNDLLDRGTWSRERPTM